MTISDLGALGEFVGSLLVLGTLIYLSIQVRQTKNMALSAASEQRSQGVRDIFMGAAQSDGLTAAIAKADATLMGDGSRSATIEAFIELGLSDEESFRVFWFNASLMRHYQTMHRSDLPAEEKRELDRRLKGYYSSPTGRFFWNNMKAGMPNDFASHVEALLHE